MRSPIRYVQVGCGGMGTAWIGHARKAGMFELVGLVDADRSRALQACAKHGLDESIVFDSFSAALEATNPEAVFDVTVPEAHASVVIPALERGCHVLGEKPMSDNLVDARRMVEAAERSGRMYAVTQTQRNRSAVADMARFLAEGHIGRIEELHLDFFIGAHFGGFREEMADVLLMDMSIHHFDAVRAVSGADAVAVWCRSWNPPRSWYRGDANAMAFFEMTGDTVFTYRGSWCAEGCNTGWTCQWRIVGSEGSALWNGERDVTIHRIKDKVQQKFIRETEVLSLPESEPLPPPHIDYMTEFARCVREGGQPQTHARDNIKSLEMVFAAVRSAHTGRRIVLADMTG
ncbi:MAG: Gfo/Idh/MocA family oxidoreductase [Phycisphaeraceae bacterium]|nr:Gfo/Idh/MocA family oxidoreductase [Phycisphaeraceae bacterium]